MTAASWLVLLGTWFIAVASPGPDFVAVLRASLRGGVTAGLRVGFGVVCGISTWITAALVGITALVSSHETVYLVVRWAGALFLLGYGMRILWGLWRARRARRVERHTAAAEVPAGGAVDAGSAGAGAAGDPAATSGCGADGQRAGGWADFRLGYLTNTVGNPKAVIFFGALFASILPHGIGLAQSVAVGLSMAAIALAFFSTLAFATSRPAVTRLYQRAEAGIDTVLGCLFVVLGIGLLSVW